ncbi:hypothetical protein ACLOJK_000597 [Asimina triloba]
MQMCRALIPGDEERMSDEAIWETLPHFWVAISMGTPSSARYISLPALFSPILLLQGAGILFALFRLVEKIVLLLLNGACTGRNLIISSRTCDYFGFLHHGSRLLGWWSIDEGSKEEQARLFHAEAAGYNTFCCYSPEAVKKMPKKDLAEEV